jgi:hypothetical protein
MGLVTVCLSGLACEAARQRNVPGRGHDIVAHEQELRDDTEDVEMDAESEEEVPELKDLVQGRCARTKRKDS